MQRWQIDGQSTNRAALEGTFQISGVRMDYPVSELGVTDYPVRKHEWDPGLTTYSKIKNASCEYFCLILGVEKIFLDGIPKAETVNGKTKAQGWVKL